MRVDLLPIFRIKEFDLKILCLSRNDWELCAVLIKVAVVKLSNKVHLLDFSDIFYFSEINLFLPICLVWVFHDMDMLRVLGQFPSAIKSQPFSQVSFSNCRSNFQTVHGVDQRFVPVTAYHSSPLNVIHRHVFTVHVLAYHALGFNFAKVHRFWLNNFLVWLFVVVKPPSFQLIFFLFYNFPGFTLVHHY